MTLHAAVVAAWVALVGLAVTGRPRGGRAWQRRVAALGPAPAVRSRQRSRRRLRSGRDGRRRRRARAAVTEAIPDVVDLFAVAVAAGLNPRLALRAVAGHAPPGPLADGLARVEDVVAATGARLADTVEALPDDLDCDALRPLVAAITDAERYGAALGRSLERLADDARRARQRDAEQAARRIPVKLLFPLVTCILPAFGLLTVAPLIAGGLRALRL